MSDKIELLAERDLLIARVKELEEALESIATGRVYRDGKPGKTPKTRARLALKGKEGDGE